MATKAIIWARVSTVQQEIEAQIKDLEVMAAADGYKADEIKTISAKGASAIKINDLFKAEINKLYDTIEANPTVEVVYVWEISRIVRNDEVTFYTLKNYFATRKIQFVCREPNFRLLNTEKEVDHAAEIVINVMATLAKQEMNVKKARFKRAKEAMAKVGKFAGGRVRYGYDVDESGFFVINEQEAEVVRMIYQLYLQRDASVRTVWEELKARGYKLLHRSVHRILKDTAYIGYVDHTNHRIYPPIIDTETYEAVKAKMASMHKDAVKSPHYYLGNKILKCTVCGHGYKATARQYMCWAHSPNNHDREHCDNSNTIDIRWFDSILWDFVWSLEVDYRLNLAAANLDEYREQITVLEQKAKAAEDIIVKTQKKIDDVVDSFVEGMISKERRNRKVEAIKAEAAEAQQMINKYKSDIESLQILIDRSTVTEQSIGETVGTVADSLRNLSFKEMHEIVRRHIDYATVEDYRLDNKKCKIIRIYPRKGGEKIYYYRTHINAKAHDKTRVYTDMRDPQTNELIPAEITMVR